MPWSDNSSCPSDLSSEQERERTAITKKSGELHKPRVIAINGLCKE